MAIVYGAKLSFLMPELLTGWGDPTGIIAHDAERGLSLAATAAAAGIAVSGSRDLLALYGYEPIWTRLFNPQPGSE
jgi:hypothetical protein